MDEWKEGIWIAISALMMASFFMLLNTIGTAVGEAARIEQSNVSSVEALKEYYRIGSFDDIIVTQSDIVNCIYNYKGKYDVYATRNITPDDYSSVTYDLIWNSGVGSASYVLEDINIVLPPFARYRAFLSKDANGAVKSIQFKRIS